jgi:hypothetical protein
MRKPTVLSLPAQLVLPAFGKKSFIDLHSLFVAMKDKENLLQNY